MKMMKFQDITLRDAQQCLWATRMTTHEMTPIAETMDAAGFSVIDLTGGAAIDSAMMYLAEDPFERIRILSKLIKNTPLNFNTRGQSIFRWMQYADDVTDFTLDVMHRNGIRSIMVFDCLNDMRNLEHSVKVGKRLGMNIIGAITYTISPVHTDEHFMEKTKELVNMGCNAIQIKDPSGILTPERARDLIPKLRQVTAGRELHLHSHCTFGHGLDTYLEALKLGEHGVDVMHCASQPLSSGYSLPAHIDIMEQLATNGYTTNVDINCIAEMDAYFGMMARRSGRPTGPSFPVQPLDIGHQVPGGMMSNLIRQLTDQGQQHRLQEVLDEVTQVRIDLGYPIMVSPMAQYIGTQAVLNVLSGKRYQMVPQEVKQYVLGYYGKVVGKIDPLVREKIAGDEPGIDVPPGQLIEPMMANYRKELAPYGSDEELALKIFYSTKVVEENRQARINVSKWTHATNPAALLAKELLGKRGLEICDVRKKDFYFSLNNQDSQTQAA